MSAKPFTMRSLVPSVPPQQDKVFSAQQLPDISTFSNLKQVIFSGGLNVVVGVTRSVNLRVKTHITFFHWSIKGSPNNAPEIQLYATINGQTRQIIRHGMPLYPWEVGQAAGDETYQDRTYNFIPPITLSPVTLSDTISVKCDGSSDGNFCLIYFEEPIS